MTHLRRIITFGSLVLILLGIFWIYEGVVYLRGNEEIAQKLLEELAKLPLKADVSPRMMSKALNREALLELTLGLGVLLGGVGCFVKGSLGWKLAHLGAMAGIGVMAYNLVIATQKKGDVFSLLLAIGFYLLWEISLWRPRVKSVFNVLPSTPITER